jgi:hypothetical protein
MIAAALVIAGCGNEERHLSARDFVDEMDQNGASLKLGPVVGTEDDAETYRVTISQTAPTPTGEGSKPKPSGSATLLVLPDAQAAMDEYDKCQGEPSLSCYRAANVILSIEDLQPTDRALLTAAISNLASDGG